MPSDRNSALAIAVCTGRSELARLLVDGGARLDSKSPNGRLAVNAARANAYVDVAVLRWQAFTGEAATLETSGASFADIGIERATKDEG